MLSQKQGQRLLGLEASVEKRSLWQDAQGTDQEEQARILVLYFLGCNGGFKQERDLPFFVIRKI